MRLRIRRKKKRKLQALKDAYLNATNQEARQAAEEKIIKMAPYYHPKE